MGSEWTAIITLFLFVNVPGWVVPCEAGKDLWSHEPKKSIREYIFRNSSLVERYSEEVGVFSSILNCGAMARVFMSGLLR